MSFAEKIQTLGRMIECKVTIAGTEYTGEDILSFNPHYEGNLYTAVMKCFECEISTKNIPSITALKGSTVYAKLGVTLSTDEEYEFKDYGEYIVYEIEEVKETKTVKLICYDRMLDSMVATSFNGELKTIEDYVNFVKDKNGWNIDVTQAVNLDTVIGTLDLSEYTDRQVLSYIAQATGSTLYMCGNTLVFGIPREKVDKDHRTIAKADFMQSEKINGGEYSVSKITVKYQKEFTDSEGNIQIQTIEESRGDDTAFEIIFEDNPFFYAPTENAMQNLLDAVKQIKYYPFEYTSNGNCDVEFLEYFDIEDGNGTVYQGLMLYNNLIVTSGIQEEAKAESPTDNAENYSTGVDGSALATIRANKALSQAKVLKERVEQATSAISKTTDGYAMLVDIEEIKDDKGDTSVIVGNGNADTLVISEYPSKPIMIDGELKDWTAGRVWRFNKNGMAVSMNGITGNYEQFAVFFDEETNTYKLNASDITAGELSGIKAIINNGAIGGFTLGEWVDTTNTTHNGLHKTFEYEIADSNETQYITFEIDSNSGSTTTEHFIKIYQSYENGSPKTGEYLFTIDKNGSVEANEFYCKKLSSSKIYGVNEENEVSCAIVGNLMHQWGRLNVNTNTTDGTVKQTVTFNTAYAKPPFVCVNLMTLVPNIKNASATNIAKESFVLNVADTSKNGEVGVTWYAVGEYI